METLKPINQITTRQPVYVIIDYCKQIYLSTLNPNNPTYLKKHGIKTLVVSLSQCH